MTILLRRLTPLVAILLSLGLVTACGSDDGSGSSSPSTSHSLAPDEGRPFDASKDMVIETVLTAMPAKKASWDGKTLSITFEKSETSATTYCLAAEGLLADDEEATLTFPSDGTVVDCSKRHGED